MACQAIRSASFPSRSHHGILEVEEELKHMKTWETNMSSVPDAETFCLGLTCLERLFTCVDNLLSSPQTQQAFSHYQHNNLVDELLVRSMRLLDICGSIKDVVSQVKEHVRDIQSAQRRRKEDLSIDGSFLRKLKKNAKKAVTELKQINQTYCRKLLDLADSHVSSVIKVARDVSEVSNSVFRMLLVFMSVFISKVKSTSKWDIVAKMIQKRTSENKNHHQICVEALGFHVEGIENAPQPRRKRGKAKNEGLEALYFKQEVGKYIWHSIPFDKPSWEAVSEAEKNAMLEHLKASFDLDKINNDPDQERIRKSLRNIYMKRYRDRKYKAHLHFNENGGDDDDIERALGNLPKGMQIESWRRLKPTYKRLSMLTPFQMGRLTH
ncbi:hypothetical protein SSX86_003119 [Deinandra increscens subsp. villosa]|uniref:Uncharacterized protein n=1 Tax=Deinandra increscens subsp. villosa TaxID=3103831 RepID=A0AAP0DGN1_9ASTR